MRIETMYTEDDLQSRINSLENDGYLEAISAYNLEPGQYFVESFYTGQDRVEDEVCWVLEYE
ncbi:MAG: hypothetical protein V7739_11015 [Motiliproteus sp.]